MKCDLFWPFAIASLLLHGAAAWYSIATFEPPVATALRKGPTSIRVQASAAAAPKAAAKPVEKPVEKAVEKVVEKSVEKLVKKTEPPPEVPKTVARTYEAMPPPKRVEPVEEPQPTPPKEPLPEAPRPTPASAGSDESRGVVADELPTLEFDPPPVYPSDDLLAGRTGRVMLLLRLDALGRVVSARVVESSGTEAMNQSALDHVLHVARFRPARQNGGAIPYTVRKPYDFTIRGR